MITEELRKRAEEILATECVDKAGWHAIVRELLESGTTPAGFGLPESQEPKYTANERGRLTNRATGVEIPDDEPIMIFRARDTHAATAIAFYANICHNSEHREMVNRRLVDFQRFAESNADRMKEPD